MTAYRLTFKDVLGIGLVTGTLGILLLAVELAVGHAHGTLATHLTMVLTVPAGVALGPPFVIGTCGLTGIALVGEEIQLRLGRRVIARQRTADLTGISMRGRVAPIVLWFRDGSRMRLFAIPVPRRRALHDALLARVPDPANVRIRD